MKMRQPSTGEAMASASELSSCPLLCLTCRGTCKATCSKAGETNKELTKYETNYVFFLEKENVQHVLIIAFKTLQITMAISLIKHS